MLPTSAISPGGRRHHSLSILSASTVVHLTLEVALVVETALVIAGVTKVTDGTTLEGTTLWYLLLANIALSGSRLVWTGTYAAAQLRAVRSAFRGKSQPKSIYTVMCTLRAVGLLLNAAEIGMSIALSVFFRREFGSLTFAIVPTRWAAVAIYGLLAPAEPLRWSAVLVGGSEESVRTVFFGRLHTMIRALMCCICEPSFTISGNQSETEATTVAAVLSMAATELLGGGREDVSLLGVVAGLEILCAAASSGSCASWPQGSPLSKEVVARCHTAVKLHHFAVGCYTGVLMDCGRLPVVGCCCWARNQCCGCDGRGSGDDHDRGDDLTGSGSAQGVHNDNCWDGHEASFRRYVGPRDSSCLLAARRSRKAGEVTFFVVQRPTEIIRESDRDCPSTSEIVVAIRGSQEIFDGITDALLVPERLTRTDLGLAAADGLEQSRGVSDTADDSTVDLGYAFTGVLACARALAGELLPVLSAALRASSPLSTTVYFVGHSLGGSTSALLALRLGPVLRGFGAASVSAICYNPMPTLNPAAIAAAGTRGMADVLSIVFRDDFASRLSLNRLVGLRRRAMAAAARADDCSNCWRAIRIASSLVGRCLLNAGAYAPKVEHAGRACTVRLELGTVVTVDDSVKVPLLSDESVLRDPPPLQPATLLVAPTEAMPPGSATAMPAATDAATRSSAAQEGHADEGELYLAGQVVHVRGTPGEMELVAVSPYAFPDMSPTPTFLVDHVPWDLQFELANTLGCTFEP